jgi:hypothetical protein
MISWEPLAAEQWFHYVVPYLPRDREICLLESWNEMKIIKRNSSRRNHAHS